MSQDDFYNIRKYDRAGKFVGFFAPGQTSIIYRLTTDSAGHIVVIGSASNGFGASVYDTDGRLLQTIMDTYSDNDGIVGRDGNYYFTYTEITMPYYHGPASYYFHITRFGADGTLQFRYPPYYLGTVQWNGGYPGALLFTVLRAVDSKGNGFVYGLGSGSGIAKIDNSGNILMNIADIGNGNLLIDAQDKLYSYDSSGNIRVHDSNGAFLYQFDLIAPTSDTGSNDVGGLFFDGRGNIYVTTGPRIDFFAPSTSVVGTVVMEGVDFQAGATVPLPNVTVQFRAPGTTAPLFTRTVTLTPDTPVVGKGAFTVDNVPPGTYDIAFKAPNSLQTTIPNVPVSGMGYGPDVFLRGGDANNDNSIDSSDFGLLIGAYNSALAILGSGYDASADFNYDGSVDSGDFFILIGNFGSVGQ